MVAAQLPRGFESSGRSDGNPLRSRGAVRVSGVSNDASHLVPRPAEVHARDEDRSGLHAIRRKHTCRARRNLADQQAQIELGILLQSASCGRESEAAG